MAFSDQVRRIGATVVDQGVSSATNILGAVVAARALDVREFGAFSVAMFVFQLVLLLNRSLVCEPLLLEPDSAIRHASLQPYLRGALSLGGTSALLLSLITVALPADSLQSALMPLALSLPLLCVQDAVRYYGFAGMKPSMALRVDAVWLILQVSAIAVLGSSSLTPVACVAIVMVPGASAGALSLLVAKIVPWPATEWISRRFSVGRHYLLEGAALNAAQYGTILFLPAVAGIQSVGVVRATQVLFGPVNVASTAMLSSMVPLAIQRLRKGDSIRALVLASSGLMALAAVVVGGSAAQIPHPVGTTLFGDTWPAVQQVLLPATLVTLTTTAMLGAVVVLRATHATARTARMRLTLMPLAVGLPLAGAEVGGTAGFLYGTAVVGALSAWWWITQALRQLAV